MGRVYADIDELVAAADKNEITRNDSVMVGDRPVKLRPNILPQCLPGSWRNPDGWIPQKAWLEIHSVQWGDSGIVISGKGAYCTAFFEMFSEIEPKFVRGEGATIAEAEEAAWQKTVRACKCKNHEFERGKYRNGAGHCKHCRMFKSDAFAPSTHCTICDVPTYWTSDKEDNWYCEKHANDIPEEKMSASSKLVRDSKREEMGSENDS